MRKAFDPILDCDIFVTLDDGDNIPTRVPTDFVEGPKY